VWPVCAHGAGVFVLLEYGCRGLRVEVIGMHFGFRYV
jgi:hypothetical protein